MADKAAPTAPEGDVWNDDKITHPAEEVKQEFSANDAAELDEAYLSVVESGNIETAQRMVDKAAKRSVPYQSDRQ